MEKLKLTVKELREIISKDSNDFYVVEDEIVGEFRHGNENEAIIKRISNGKFFRVNYRTSCKDECEFSDINFDSEYDEVVPYEVTITKYK